MTYTWRTDCHMWLFADFQINSGCGLDECFTNLDYKKNEEYYKKINYCNVFPSATYRIFIYETLYVLQSVIPCSFTSCALSYSRLFAHIMYVACITNKTQRHFYYYSFSYDIGSESTTLLYLCIGCCSLADRRGVAMNDTCDVKVPMAPKFLLHDVKKYLKLFNTSSFKLLRCNVLYSLNCLFSRLIYVTLCIMSCC